MNPIVLCLSGGLDSSVAAIVLRRSHDVFPLFVDYGQEAAMPEQDAARNVSRHLGLAPLEVARMPCWQRTSGMGGLSPFFMPHRNLMFSAIALNYAAHVHADGVALGFVADTDSALFPDATGDSAKRLSAALRQIYGRADNWEPVVAPVSHRFKSDLIVDAIDESFPLELTYSCYRAARCSKCPACVAVRGAFSEAARLVVPERRALVEAHNPYMRLGISPSMSS